MAQRAALPILPELPFSRHKHSISLPVDCLHFSLVPQLEAQRNQQIERDFDFQEKVRSNQWNESANVALVAFALSQQREKKDLFSKQSEIEEEKDFEERQKRRGNEKKIENEWKSEVVE